MFIRSRRPKIRAYVPLAWADDIMGGHYSMTGPMQCTVLDYIHRVRMFSDFGIRPRDVVNALTRKDVW